MKVRPTRHATIFFFILGAMFLASINYQSNAAWLMVFVVLTTGGMSALHGWRNVSPAVITVADPPLVEAGDRARLGLTVACTARRDLEALVVELPPDQAPAAALTRDAPQRLLVLHVPSLGSVRVELILPSFKRGVHRISTLQVSTQYPLGLWRAVRRVPVAIVLFVHPEPRGVSLAQAQPDPDAEVGAGASGAQREHEDFRGLKPWQPGDSQRHIDWKAAARGAGPLLIKEWSGGGHGVTWISWAATAGDDEIRLSQLAKWIVEAHHGGRCYGLRLPGQDIEPATGGIHHQNCLRALAGFSGESRSSASRPSVSAAVRPELPPGPRPGSTASISGVHRIPTGADRRARAP